MPDRRELLVEAAESAVAAGDWEAARRAFEALVVEQPTAEVLAGLGDVLWWLGDTVEAVHCQERAFSAFQRRGDHAAAATIGVGLYLIYRVSLGNTAVARGWLSRVGRLVEEGDLAPLAGWVTLLRAHDAGAPADAERLATRARELASRFADVDLELCALSLKGAALLALGRVEQGRALMDEAMVASLAGESTRPHTVVFTSCTLIGACSETADTEHVLQWIRAADGFHRRYGSAHLYTTCRTYLGAALFAAGDWDGAERELRAALRVGAAAEPAVCAEAAARLAELRLAQGRLEEAERLLEGYEDFDTSAVALAGVAIARGDTARARRVVLRRTGVLRGEGADPLPGSHRPGLSGCLEEAALWEVVAMIAEPTEARHAVERLAQLADATGCEPIRARALRASGRLDADPAQLERAVARFGRLLPLEQARTRLALSALLEGNDAAAEARAALRVFEVLGAQPDADAAAARLRELGAPATRGRALVPGTLTRREQEVLALLGEGLSNSEVAARLFVSRKTIERHVRNVFVKLGVRNRTEAAAYALRHPELTRATK